MLHFDNFDFKHQKVLVRVDFNVPLNDKMEISDDTRIMGAVPTINKILKDGGSVVLMSHLGRPKEGPVDKYSLSHLLPRLKELFGNDKVFFANDCISEDAFKKSSTLGAGEILLLENLRFYKEEEKGDKSFAEKLSHHGNIYINDAFGTAHRAHASTSIIAEFFTSEKKGFGYLMNAEIENAEFVLHKAVKPVTAIVGGAKVSDKIQLLERLIDIMDNILIGGGMAYTFIAAQGGKIGTSLCEPDFKELALKIMEKAKNQNTKIYLPVDSLAANRFAADAEILSVNSNEIPDGWMGLDIGPLAIEEYSTVVKSSKTILWNGPMGVFEFPAFSKGTFSIASSVADATSNGAFSLIGGGDSVSAIHQSGLSSKVSYISTGGGAMLEFLEGKELPGIKAIKE
ncbi:MAG: phosphoglycerate kinase [Saprospiraceae bacterium]|nr:phosphoglycerate kinase [Saprospiraceae bacterium]MBK8819215.1 phosphoglycerate kinase [Saprospiraceae bacterium]